MSVGHSESTGEPGGAGVTTLVTGDDTVRLYSGPRVVERVTAHPLVPVARDTATMIGETGGRAGDHAWLTRRRLSHDIRHELATIMLLASLMDSAQDVGADSRQRARQLLGEARWLDRLHRAYEETLTDGGEQVGTAAEPIRLDLFAGEVVGAARLSTSTTIRFSADEAWAHADRLAFWRALRNMVGNAVRAAGPDGNVDVRIRTASGWATAEVDDDGPGFGAGPSGTASLGLGIVRDFAIAWGGYLEIRRGALGGCCVRLRMRAASPAAPHAGGGRDAAADL
jgi:signal transduction histidine kinase